MSDNRPPKVPTSQLIFPNAENTNAGQIQNLLNIGSFALHALLRPEGGQGTSVPGQRVPFPPEAEIAAENTFIKVLSVFDAMLEDKPRWSLENQQRLQARFDEAHTLNLKYLAGQAAFAEEMLTPHFRFKPQLLRLRDGRMLAMVGNVEDLDNAICGIGGSAEEALRKFDEMFSTGINKEVADHLLAREAALDAGQTPPPYPGTPEPTVEEKPKTKNKRKKQ